MNQWRCNDTKAWAAAFLSGQMTREEDRLLGAHLQTCESCRSAISQIHSAHRYVESLTQESRATAKLSADRLAVLSAVASGERTVPRRSTPVVDSAVRTSWAMAAAAAVVLSTAFIGGRIGELPIDVADNVDAATEIAQFDYSPLHDYPTSFGMVYPANFSENGGYVAGEPVGTLPIDYDSIDEELLRYYDPAYGLGRSVVDYEYRAAADTVPVWYGVDGPRGDFNAGA